MQTSDALRSIFELYGVHDEISWLLQEEELQSPRDAQMVLSSDIVVERFELSYPSWQEIPYVLLLEVISTGIDRGASNILLSQGPSAEEIQSKPVCFSDMKFYR